MQQGSHRLAAGYQGSTLLYDDGNEKYVIKAPHGSGLTRILHKRLLRHEHEAYTRLQGHPNVPRCFGLLDGEYLVLEFIDAPTTRQRPPGKESTYHRKLFDAIALMHEKKVAHIDLKRKDNILIKDDDTPVMIDFGTAILYRPGLRPINHYLFRLGVRFDWNAWIKHKYQGRMDEISEEDLPYYNRTWYEKGASRLKSAYRKLTGQ